MGSRMMACISSNIFFSLTLFITYPVDEKKNVA